MGEILVDFLFALITSKVVVVFSHSFPYKYEKDFLIRNSFNTLNKNIYLKIFFYCFHFMYKKSVYKNKQNI